MRYGAWLPGKIRLGRFLIGGTYILISVLPFYSLKGDPLPGVKFIENQKQWPDQVYFAAEVPGGKLFLEQNKLTFAFYDISQF